MKRPNRLPLVLGCIALALWLLFEILANAVQSSSGQTVSSVHALCQSAFVAALAGRGCHTVNTWYLLATLAFWAGFLLTAFYFGRLFWLRRTP